MISGPLSPTLFLFSIFQLIRSLIKSNQSFVSLNKCTPLHPQIQIMPLAPLLSNLTICCTGLEDEIRVN
jgi:hypothetical protein